MTEIDKKIVRIQLTISLIIGVTAGFVGGEFAWALATFLVTFSLIFSAVAFVRWLIQPPPTYRPEQPNRMHDHEPYNVEQRRVFEGMRRIRMFR